MSMLGKLKVMLLVGLVALWSGCSEQAAPSATQELNEACEQSTQCVGELLCFEGLCRKPCNEDEDCEQEREHCDFGVCLPGASIECGNSVLEPSEECDLGDTQNDDGCDDNCLIEAGWYWEADDEESLITQCGDGVKVGDEACDDGNTERNDACPSGAPGLCYKAYCGDNYVNSGVEACDDGNTSLEKCEYAVMVCEVCGPQCQYEPGIISYCGDGKVDYPNGEHCEDGNTDAWDGCNDCQASEFPANVDFDDDQAFARIASDGSSLWLVVWEDRIAPDGSLLENADVLMAIYDIHGERLKEPFRVNSTTLGNHQRPAIAGNASGRSVVTWQGDGLNIDPLYGFYDIFVQVLDSNGVPLGNEMVIELPDTSAAYYTYWSSDVFMADNGDFVVVWNNYTESLVFNSNKVFAQCYHANGDVKKASFQIDSDNKSYAPSIAGASDGRFVVTWTSSADVSGEEETHVRAQRFTAGCEAVGSDFRVNSYALGEQQNAAVSMADSGDFVVVWDSLGQEGNGSVATIGKMFSAAGAPLGGEIVLNTFIEGSQQKPRVVMNGQGGFVAVWESEMQDGNGFGVFGQRFDASGEPLGAEFKINHYTLNNQQAPQLAIDNMGNFAVVWQSYGQVGEQRDILMQRYNNLGMAMGKQPF